ncbi:MAG: lytic transglycosylase domain-containing protein [Candidatus Gastranaerophilales bacterium]|nr:lytic transglycosylase domain-containing protein [Candidatus Gastranaerophilales bacterium]
MTQGISSSLNLALARISYIENSFSALEKISGQSQAISTIESDFKNILDTKAKTIDTIENKPESTPNTKDIEPELKEAIELKSKIDLKAQSTNIDEIVETFAQKYDIDSDFIKAIIKQESGFNTKATSKKGAMGLMQLMPKTAESLGVIDAYDPNQNIEGGVKYLKGLLEKYDNNKEMALAAYNAGPTAVKKYGGIPPYKETQNYINAIMGTYNKVKGAELL